MQLSEWTKHPTENLYMRSAISYRGGIIGPKGMKQGLPEYSPRRYSVVDGTGVGVKLVVGAVAYKQDYDSEDIYQAHKKYLVGEFDSLLVVEFAGTSEEAVTLWPGIIQQINNVG